MFNDIFLLKLLLSFATGGFFVLVTVAIAERYGPVLGGVAAGLPSTTAAGLFFIGFVQSPQDASVAATMIPAAVSASLVFVATYVYLCGRWNHISAVAAASVAWFAIALPLAASGLSNILLSTILYAIVWILSMSYLSGKHSGTHTPKGMNKDPRYLIMRVVFAGTVVSSAVIASAVSGPLIGGAIAAFPAMFLTTFVILGRDHGREYSVAFAKTTPIGLLSVVPYAWGVHYLYPQYGIVTGTLVSYLIAFFTAFLAYKTLKDRRILSRRSSPEQGRA